MDFINRQHDARQHADRQGVVAVEDDLVEYTLSHFAFEECLMEDAGYEFVRGHKKVHELFVRRVASFSDRLKRARTSPTNCTACCTAGCSATSGTTTMPTWPPSAPR